MTPHGDSLLAERLSALADPHDDSNWENVVERATDTLVVVGRFRRHRVLLLVSAAAVLMLALGAALAATFGGFSGWLTGEPGSPASATEQSAFNKANARSWASFPKDTRLRRLIVARVDGVSFRLFGFRAGDEICLRLTVNVTKSFATMSCIPRLELVSAKAPAAAILLDVPAGKIVTVATGRTRAGHRQLARIRSSKVSFGVTADGVSGLEVRTDRRDFRAVVHHNAFLLIRKNVPYAGRADAIDRITAIGANGERVPVPFHHQLFFQMPIFNKPRFGPAKIERRPRRSSIGWLERQEPRGLSLSQAHVPLRWLLTNGRRVHFVRVIRPNPDEKAQVVVVRYGIKRDRICFMTVAAGWHVGCIELLPTSPLTETTEPIGRGKTTLVSGIARDAVSRLALFLDSGKRLDISPRDNAFAASFPESGLPARLVGYDSAGKVIAVRDYVTQRTAVMPRPKTPRFGPTHIDRKPEQRSIAWVLRRETRGQSLQQAHIPASRLYGYHLGIHFARVTQPDPGNHARVVITVVGKHHAICTATIDSPQGGPGGCVRLREFPLAASLSVGSGDQTSLISGIASDSIARIDLFLNDGERWPVPLKDNAFVASVPSTELPARLVGFDADGKVVAIQDLGTIF